MLREDVAGEPAAVEAGGAVPTLQVRNSRQAEGGCRHSVWTSRGRSAQSAVWRIGARKRLWPRPAAGTETETE